MRWLLVLCCLGFASLSQASVAHLQGRVDKILVVKSERTLHLLNKGQSLKTYKVSLGKKSGPKLHEGDQRTPEGLYWIDWRKTSNKFNLSMHISYPNARDTAKAREKGLAPGSMIMLHGTPVDAQYPEWYFSSLNWTDGCIALSNTDMQEIWSLVPDGTLIEIKP
ncbi:L,D-transpeptidase-like protein [Azomonas agilis]|uniref:L,D-transpeptidase-like protein n=1 Tax=Azomonas agilis TaxID=116849 RepID=A0A562I1I1_9GAMM|nr:L,D-transpeptidase family protein [Azomonas agilis]TWH64513.1 L,D-transpeptidase-like protein [Azomonas agilis]